MYFQLPSERSSDALICLRKITRSSYLLVPDRNRTGLENAVLRVWPESQLMLPYDFDKFIHGNVAVAEEPFSDDADADPCAAGVGVVVLGWDRRTRDRCVGGDDVARDRVKVRPRIGGVIAAEKAAVL